MSTALALVSAALWWVLYGSILALFCALIAAAVLRWTEPGGVVFNRVYLACLLWSLLGLLLIGGVALAQGHARPPYAALFASPSLRAALVLDMLVGAALLWRLIPRRDARRIRPASACLAAVVVVVVEYGVVSALM